jgi:hypothetical protein
MDVLQKQGYFWTVFPEIPLWIFKVIKFRVLKNDFSQNTLIDGKSI